MSEARFVALIDGESVYTSEWAKLLFSKGYLPLSSDNLDLLYEISDWSKIRFVIVGDNIPQLEGLDIFPILKHFTILAPFVFVTSNESLGYIREAYSNGVHSVISRIADKEAEHEWILKNLKINDKDVKVPFNEPFPFSTDNYFDFQCITDFSGNILYVCAEHANHLGYSETGLITKSLLEFIHPDDFEQTLNKFNCSKDLKQAGIMEFRFRKADHSFCWLEMHTNIIKNRLNQVTGIYLFAHSIDSRKKIEKELDQTNIQLTNLINTIPDIIYFKDHNLRNVIVNESYAKLTGKPTSFLINKTDSEILPQSLADECHESDNAIKETKRTLKFEEKLTMSNGKIIYFETIKTPIYNNNGHFIGITGVSRDITNRKLTEEILEKKISFFTQPKVENYDLQFENLFTISEIQQIQDAFSNATGVASVITDHSGNPITKPSNSRRLCDKIIRKTKLGLCNCIDSDNQIGKSDFDGPVMKHCNSAGLFDGGACITVGNTPIAHWFIGQVIDNSSDIETLLLYADKIGVDREEYRSALLDVPRMSHDQFYNVCQSVFLFAKQLSTLAYQNYKQAAYISEIKQIDKTLKESESLYRSLFESSADGITLSRLDGVAIMCNHQKAKMLGFDSSDEIVGVNEFNLVKPEFKSFAETHLSEFLNTGGIDKIELEILRKDGSWFPAEITTCIIPDENLHPQYLLTIFRDITIRKNAEKELLESQEKYKVLVESSEDIIIRFDQEFRHLFVNPVISKYFPFNPTDYISKSIRQMRFNSDFCDYWEDILSIVFKYGKKVIDEFLFTGDKGKIWFEWHVLPELNHEGKVVSVISTLRDITWRKEIEDRIVLSEQRYRSIIENQEDLVCRWLPDSTLTFVNQTYCNFFGLKDELVGKQWYNLIDASIKTQVVEFYSSMVQNPKPYHHEREISDLKGELHWIAWNELPVFDSNGKLLEFQSVGRDITQRIQTETALRESEEKYRKIFENVQDVFYQTNLDGIILEISPSVSRYTNYTREQLIGEPIICIYQNPDNRTDLIKIMTEKGEIVDYEIQVKNINDEPLWVSVNSHFIFGNKNEKIGMEGSLRDITERKKADQKIKEQNEELQNQNEEYLALYKELEQTNQNLVLAMKDLDSSLNAVAEGELKYRSLFDNMLNGFALYEMIYNELNEANDYRYIMVNPSFERMTGLKGEEIKGKTVKDVLPDTENFWIESYNEVVKTKQPLFFENFSRKFNKYYEVSAFPAGGNKFAAVFNDITERVLAIQKMRDTRDFYLTILEKLPTLIWRATEARNFDYFNNTWLVFTGRSLKDEKRMGWIHSVHSEDINKIVDLLFNAFETKENFFTEFRLRNALGQYRWMVNYGSPYNDMEGHFAGFIGTCIDITDRKLAETDLKLDEARLESLLKISQMNQSSIEDIFDLALEEAINLTSSKIGYFYYYDEDNQEFTHKVLSMEGINGSNIQRTNQIIPLSESGHWGEAIRLRKPILLNHYLKANSQSENSPYGHIPLNRNMSIPVFFGNRIVALVGVANKSTDYSETDVRQLILLMDTLWKIVEQRRIENDLLKSEQEKSIILNGLEDVLVEYIDSDLEVIYSNRPLNEKYNIHNTELFERKCFTMLHDLGTHCEDCSVIKCFNTGEALQSEITTPLGQSFLIKCYPIFDENTKVSGVIHLAINITDRKNVEIALIQAKENAEEADRLKSAFLANMSHEIRTPMNAIIGFSDMLMKPNLTPEKKQQFTTVIKNRCHDLLAIIDDILDISKIEAGQLKVINKNFSINDMLDDLMAVARHKLDRSGKENIELKGSNRLEKEQCVIYSDTYRIKQILINFIDNAIKFTQDGSIEIGYLLLSPNVLKFYVKDTGIGILEEKFSTIFERFRQADDSSTRDAGGIGLGLSICKGLVILLGGEIGLKSIKGSGSEFYFTIPYHSSEFNEPKTEMLLKTEVPNFKDVTLMIVEDDENNIEFLIELLEDTGIKMEIARTPEAALTKLKKHQAFDLILMDIQLPGMNGWDLTRLMKKSNPALQIIAQTAYAMEQDKIKSFDAGCNAFIPKPIDSIKLLQTMESLLKGRIKKEQHSK